MDRLTLHQRHKNMASIRSANTKPEILVRKYLWKHGFRYRLNNPRLPGHPDIVLRKYRTCVFVNGCFWHGHDGCKYFRMPKTNTDFWEKKINRNKERDKEEQKKLAEMGWHVIVVWEFMKFTNTLRHPKIGISKFYFLYNLNSATKSLICC